MAQVNPDLTTVDYFDLMLGLIKKLGRHRFPQISPIKSPRERSRKQPKKNTEKGLQKSSPITTGNNTTRP
jgi:hypothetical protein